MDRRGTAWASKFGGACAQFTFASSVEPWVLCAAQYRHHHELQRLWQHFGDDYGYKATTVILDPLAAFTIKPLLGPQWLGAGRTLPVRSRQCDSETRILDAA